MIIKTRPGKAQGFLRRLVACGLAIISPLIAAGSAHAYIRQIDIRRPVGAIVLASLTHPDEAPIYLLTCLMLRSEGNLGLALDACNRAVSLDRGEPEAFRLRGGILLELGQADRALIDFSELVSLTPNDVSGHELRGMALFMLHRRRDAFEDFNAAVHLDPHDPSAFLARGSAYQAQDKFARAMSDFSTAIALGPDDADAWTARCWSRVIANANLTGALSDCRQALKLEPQNAAASDATGWAYLRLGRAQDALVAFDAALAAAPAQASSLFGRGIAKLRLGRIREGRFDIAEAKLIEPGIEKRFRHYGIALPATIPLPQSRTRPSA